MHERLREARDAHSNLFLGYEYSTFVARFYEYPTAPLVLLYCIVSVFVASVTYFFSALLRYFERDGKQTPAFLSSQQLSSVLFEYLFRLFDFEKHRCSLYTYTLLATIVRLAVIFLYVSK